MDDVPVVFVSLVEDTQWAVAAVTGCLWEQLNRTVLEKMEPVHPVAQLPRESRELYKLAVACGVGLKAALEFYRGHLERGLSMKAYVFASVKALSEQFLVPLILGERALWSLTAGALVVVVIEFQHPSECGDAPMK